MNSSTPHPDNPPQSSSADEWYYVLGDKRRGPVSEQALIATIESGVLNKKTKIWKEGFPKWIILGNTGFVEFLPKAEPPPLDQVDTEGSVEEETPRPRPPPVNSPKAFFGGRDDYHGTDPGKEKTEAMYWYIKVIQNYAVFNGRARRKEYWMFSLFSFIVWFVLSLIEGLLGGSGVLADIYSLAVAVPTIAVSIRRMHDTDHSGWFFLIPIYDLILAVRVRIPTAVGH